MWGVTCVLLLLYQTCSAITITDASDFIRQHQLPETVQQKLYECFDLHNITVHDMGTPQLCKKLERAGFAIIKKGMTLIARAPKNIGPYFVKIKTFGPTIPEGKIGRASCRERV